jgi:hypothetical protein
MTARWGWGLLVVASMAGVLVLPPGAWRGLAVLVLLVNAGLMVGRAVLWIRRRLLLADILEAALEADRRRDEP